MTDKFFRPAKPDPRILIAQIIVVSVLGFSFGNWTAIMLLFVLVDILACHFLGRQKSVKFLAVYATVFCAQRLLTLFYIPFISQVFAMFLILILKSIPVYITLLILMQHTPMNELIAALRKIHIPMFLLIPFSVMYRYLPTIRQEFTYIHESLIMRGLHSSVKKVVCNPMQSAEHYLVPLLFRSEQIVEELTAATLCKGLDVNRERTCCTEVKLQCADYLYLSAFLILTGGLIYVNFKIYLL